MLVCEVGPARVCCVEVTKWAIWRYLLHIGEIRAGRYDIGCIYFASVLLRECKQVDCA